MGTKKLIVEDFDLIPPYIELFLDFQIQIPIFSGIVLLIYFLYNETFFFINVQCEDSYFLYLWVDFSNFLPQFHVFFIVKGKQFFYSLPHYLNFFYEF